MAVVVGISTVITQETHRVTLSNVLWVCLDELLCAIPQCWNGFHILVQTQHETVLLLVVGHEFESVIVNVAVKLNAWLNSPVPLIVQHQLLTEKEAGFESAHVAIADRVSVDDLALSHVFADLASLILIDVIWVGPMLLRNLSIMSFARYEGRGDLLECRIERLVVQEDPVVMKLAVEPIFDLTD